MSNLREKVKARFDEKIKNHSMQVLKDDGPYRHLRFSDNGSSIYRFDIITWPGHLTIAGDVDTFVFSRIPDMFEFFRDDDGKINPSYWAKKLLSMPRDGYNEFSPDAFETALNEDVDGFIESRNFSEDTIEEIRESIQDSIMFYAAEEHEAYRQAYEYDETFVDEDNVLHTLRFDDIFEYNFREHRYHYLWCCYAIVHAIAEYDKLKAGIQTNEAVC